MNTPEIGSETMTRHAEARMSQRGYSPHDLDLIQFYGTPVADGYLLTQADVAAVARDLQRLERIAGTFLVEQEGTVITLYRPSKGRRRRVMRQEARRRPRARRQSSSKPTSQH